MNGTDDQYNQIYKRPDDTGMASSPSPEFGTALSGTGSSHSLSNASTSGRPSPLLAPPAPKTPDSLYNNYLKAVTNSNNQVSF